MLRRQDTAKLSATLQCQRLQKQFFSSFAVQGIHSHVCIQCSEFYGEIYWCKMGSTRLPQWALGCLIFPWIPHSPGCVWAPKKITRPPTDN